MSHREWFITFKLDSFRFVNMGDDKECIVTRVVQIKNSIGDDGV